MSIKELSHRFDDQLNALSLRFGLVLIQFSIGLIYLWFGALKFFSGLSPAEELAGNTLSVLTFHLIDHQILIWALALIEIIIGVCMFLQIRSKVVLSAVFVHMIGTLLPLFIFPEIVFNQPPFGFSMVGQYIMKNFVIISALIMIYSRRGE